MFLRGALICLLLFSSAASAQTLDDLRRLLGEREAEVQQLRERITVLEQQQGTTAPALTLVAAPLAAGTPSEESEEPEDVNRALERALVRQGGLLLAPGTVEAEVNFSYSHIGREMSAFRREAFGPGVALRVGLPLNSQFNVSLPYVFEQRDSASGASSGNGIGDVALSLSHQFAMEGVWRPNLFTGIGYSFGTGENTVFTSSQPIALGTGFNALTAWLTATKRSDPLVLFGSYSYSHSFADRKGDRLVDLGDSHALRFGTWLAASPTASLRVGFDVVFFGETQIDNVPIRGTDEPASSLEVGGSFLFGDRTLFDLAVGAGLTRSAPDFRITGALPVRF